MKRSIRQFIGASSVLEMDPSKYVATHMPCGISEVMEKEKQI